MVTAWKQAHMSVYLVTREGQELGTFKTSKIEKGLRTGFFRLSDLGWREASGWQGLAEIVGPAPSRASLMSLTDQNSPDGVNPYATPSTSVQAGSSGVVPQEVMVALAHTQGWVRCISIVLWVACALLLLFMAFGIYFIAAAAQTDAKLVELPVRTLAFTLGYGFVAIVIMYPTLKLSKYASKIARLRNSRSFSDLAAALDEQRRFWKFSGILMILHVALTLLLLIASMFVTRVH